MQFFARFSDRPTDRPIDMCISKEIRFLVRSVRTCDQSISSMQRKANLTFQFLFRPMDGKSLKGNSHAHFASLHLCPSTRLVRLFRLQRLMMLEISLQRQPLVLTSGSGWDLLFPSSGYITFLGTCVFEDFSSTFLQRAPFNRNSVLSAFSVLDRPACLIAIVVGVFQGTSSIHSNSSYVTQSKESVFLFLSLQRAFLVCVSKTHLRDE